MPTKIAIGFFCVVLSAWALGLYFSVLKTKRVTREFYQWVHDDPSLIDCDFPLEPKESAARIVERFQDSNLSFKKHIRIAVGSLPGTKMPRSYRPTTFGSATNGTSFEHGISLTNSYYFAYIRTPVEPEMKTARAVSVAIETTLFGL